jgi:hypothetical protein
MAEESKSKVHKLYADKPNVRKPYAKYKYLSEFIKVRLQMIIGLVLVFFILCDIIHTIVPGMTLPFGITFPDSIINIIKMPVLGIVAGALYLSTAIDLAYMLFTSALDEAIDPVISGLAATILLTISKIEELKDLTVSVSVGIALLGIVLAMLFIVKKFTEDKNSKVKQVKNNRAN